MGYASVYLNYTQEVSLHPGNNGKSQKDMRQGLDIMRSVFLKDVRWWCWSWVRGNRTWKPGNIYESVLVIHLMSNDRYRGAKNNEQNLGGLIRSLLLLRFSPSGSSFFLYQIFYLGWCSLVDWVWACEAQGRRFDSQSRAHVWVASQVPSRGHVRGNHLLMFLSLSFSFPSPLSKNK